MFIFQINRRNLYNEVGFGLDIFFYFASLFDIHHNTHQIAVEFAHLFDFGVDAVGANVLFFGQIYFTLVLCAQKQNAVAFHRIFQGKDGFGS